MSTKARCIGALLAAALAGCASEPPPLAIGVPDAATFQSEVYPVLLRDCGFHACHGSTERFLQVFGPGRGRLRADTQPLDPATDEEVAYSYDRARSMIDLEFPEQSLLLAKPLSVAAGGFGHQGVDSLGRDVYLSVSDPGFMALANWVLSALNAPPQVPLPGQLQLQR
jgi:hypothetical protein